MSNVQDNAAHTCSYSCDRPECIKAQRDELAAAAAQEAVDFYVCDSCGHHYMDDGVTCDCTGRANNPPLRHVRMAPVTAAPAHPRALTASIARLDAFLDGECAELLTPAQSEAAALVLQELKRRMASTPAAPGIDMGVPGATLTIDGKTFTVDEVRAALLPGASPKDELESWKRGTKACAEVLGQVMRQTQDSPKGGSEARDAARYRWLREFAVNGSIGIPFHGWLNCDEPAREWDSAIDAAMQAGDAEVQP